MKQTEPIANNTPIHQEARRGAHHREPGLAAARRGGDACVRRERNAQSMVEIYARIRFGR
jgi:hypothetical protein